MAATPKGRKPEPHKSPPAKPAATKKAAGVAASAKSATPPKTKPPAADWDRIELDYRAGIKALRQMAEEHGITEGAIRKRAKRDDWTRDLAARIQDKAEQLVRTEAVRSEVRTERAATEREVVDANAHAVALVRLEHRKDIHRGRRIANALFDELEKQADPETIALLEELGELMRNPDDNGQDRRNDLYMKVISLPERARTAKTLAETLRIVIDMERTAFGMDAKDADKPAPGSPGHVPPAVAIYHVAPPPRPPEDDED